MSQSRRKNSTGRTNSLGFAKADCHTCRDSGRPCDRQRPQCGTCIKNHHKCAGFAIDLMWKSRASVCDIGASQVRGGRPKRGFKFVQGGARSKRKGNGGSRNRHDSSDSAHDQLEESMISNSDTHSYDLDANIIMEANTPMSSNSLDHRDTFEVAGMEVVQFRQGLSPAPSIILFNDLAHKMGPVLDMFDKEFCILPLSMDIRDNPYRPKADSYRDSPSLLHATLALSFQHLAKQQNSKDMEEQTYHHQSAAIHGFSQALMDSRGTSLLDTLLTLVNLEISQSAVGAWNVHLKGAQTILDGLGFAEVFSNTRRIRAQLAILLWWDTTVGFISREMPKMPEAYLDVLMVGESMDEPTFFALNGCPYLFMRIMWQFAKMAASYKQTLLEHGSFDMQQVDDLVECLKEWINDDALSIEGIQASNEDPDNRMDRIHCVEAWRHAIILYSRRVFRSHQDSADLRVIDHLTRMILDHVRCIRETQMVQKQVLLPVFLAAVEVEDENSRCFVRQYCNRWSKTARYTQFETALALIENIWATYDSSQRAVYWWGCKMDDYVCSEEGDDSGYGIEKELLLG